MLWVELVEEAIKSTGRPEARSDKTIEVNAQDVADTVKMAEEYKADIDTNIDKFVTGVGMELALRLLGLWSESEDEI